MASLWNRLKKRHNPASGALALLKAVGPGLLVTVGFIDPGNWATNLAAGADFGYALLWVVTFSSVMLVVVQHNAAHLGITTGLCLAEATTRHIPKFLARPILGSAMLANISTALAEIVGGAVALEMLFGVPLRAGAVLVAGVCAALLFANTYARIEKWVILFVSLIGLSFLYELFLVDVDWDEAARAAAVPSLPEGSLVVVMAVLGAVVMPHNLFLHSEVVQSRQWNLESEDKIENRLRYEFLDTLFAIAVGWAINSAMVILAATTFHKTGQSVGELSEAYAMLAPIAGSGAALVFAAALLCAGVASTVTSGIAGATIFAGMFGEAYQPKDIHSKTGVLLSFVPALAIVFFVESPLRALVLSQMLLSAQLPITIFTQVYLTSSKKVMGAHANKLQTTVLLAALGGFVSILNLVLLASLF